MCTPVPVYETFPGTGSQTSFQHQFPLEGSFSTVEVKIREGDESDFHMLTEGLLSEGGDYTYTRSTKTVSIHIPPASVDLVRIERCTNRNRVGDYIGGTTITEANLDDDMNQAFSFMQELESDLSNAMRLNDAGTEWDAQGLPIGSLAPATEGDQAVTYAQLLSSMTGKDTAVIDAADTLYFTGDGAETQWELTGYKNLTAEEALVHVDTAFQQADGASYTISSPDDSDYPDEGDGVYQWIIFSSPPPSSSSIEVRIISGTVLTNIPINSVGPDEIEDDAVGIDHLNFGAGANTRFLVIDTAGDPEARIAVHTDVSDFDTGVRENRLDQMAAPTANVSMNSRKVTNLLPGTASTDAVNKAQLDGVTSPITQASKGSIDDITAEGSAFKEIVTLGWQPEIVHITLDFTTEASFDISASYTAVFSGVDTIRRVNGGQMTHVSYDGQIPIMAIKKISSGFELWIHDKGDAGVSTALSTIRYVAMKI